MKTNVTKKDFVKALLPVVQMTRGGADVADMCLTDDSEYVIVSYSDGRRQRIDVSADSGISLVKDVCQAIS